MKKTSKRIMVSLAVSSVSLFFIVSICLALFASGAVTPSVSCFAVDNLDRLYIGTQKEIQIYEKGQIVNCIHVPTSRTYVFTILDGNKILLSTSTIVYLMDLDGNVLETKEDRGADTYNQISYRKRKFISDNGDVYRISNILGRTRIIKNQTDIVYQINALSVAVKILLVISAAVILMFSIWVLFAQKTRP